jgi:hypothetical protein
METNLTLSIGGFPPFSARGCVQKLVPISVGEFFRTLNGDLVYTARSQEKKYHTFIQCQDQTPPATDGLIPGISVKVGCIQRIWQKWDGNVPIQLEKDSVFGSVLVMNKHRASLKIREQRGRQVIVDSQLDGGFVCYRPLLTMRLIRYALTTQEWNLSVSWEMELEEV